MSRRLALTCVVLSCSNLAQSTVFTVFVSIVTLVVERESAPYINPFLSAFTYALHWQIGRATAARQPPRASIDGRFESHLSHPTRHHPTKSCSYSHYYYSMPT